MGVGGKWTEILQSRFHVEQFNLFPFHYKVLGVS